MRFLLLVFPLLCFSQLHHQTLSASGGSSQYVIYSTGQSSVIGNTSSNGNMVSQGYVQPISGSYFIEQVSMDMSVSIYPNPFEQQFKALLDNKYNNIQVIVQNTPGQIVYNKTFSDSKELVIDIPNLAAQTYLITIQADQKTFYAKLIKQ